MLVGGCSKIALPCATKSAERSISILIAVEGIYEIASAEEPTTIAKMRTLAKRLNKLATPIWEYLDPLVESLSNTGIDALQELLDALGDLEDAEDEARDAEDAMEVDVIGYAENFMDAWRKTKQP